MTPALTRRLYITVWLMLGTIALGYFYFLFYTTRSPQLGQSSIPLPPVAQSQSSDKTNSDKTAAVIDPGVSKAITHMRLEIDRLKGSLGAIGKENAALKAHIKTLETAFGTTTASLPRDPVKPHPSGLDAKDTARSAPRPKIDVTMLPMPGNGFSETEMPQAPLPIAGLDAPTRTLFAIEIAKTLEPEAAWAYWTALKKRHAKILRDLKPRIVEISSNGTGKKAVSLIAGPFTNVATAARTCARLIAAKTKCKSTVYTGTPIGKLATR